MDMFQLPPASTKRWSKSKKYKVLLAIRLGLISQEQARSMYGFSVDELKSMSKNFDRFGVVGLRATQVQYYKNLLRESSLWPKSSTGRW